MRNRSGSSAPSSVRAEKAGRVCRVSRSPAEGWTEGRLVLTLAQGRYRVITTVRLPSGDQLAARREVELRAGEARGFVKGAETNIR